jgi:hypothetical protein
MGKVRMLACDLAAYSAREATIALNVVFVVGE